MENEANLSFIDFIKERKKNIKPFFNSLEKTFPELYKKLTAKNYPPNIDYIDFDIFTYFLGINMMNPIEDDKVSQLLCVSSWQLVNMHIPVYWISKNILKAIQETKLPEDIKVNEINWPLSSMLIMIPRNQIFTPEGGDVGFFVPHMRKKGEVIPTPKSFYPIRPATKDCWGYYTMDLKTGVMYSANDPTTESVKELADVENHDFFFSNKYELSSDEREWTTQMRILVLKIIMFMTAMPEMIEPGFKIRRAKRIVGGKKQKCDLMSPNWIGKNYKIKTKENLGSDDSGDGKIGWRKGHLKSQRYGKKWAKVKIIWIEPYMVGGK